jgi:hypothetical protein
MMAMEAAPSPASQCCVHTDPSAKSDEFEINSPKQKEPAVFEDRGRYLRDSRTQLRKAAYCEIVSNQAHVENYLARRTFSH